MDIRGMDCHDLVVLSYIRNYWRHKRIKVSECNLFTITHVLMWETCL